MTEKEKLHCYFRVSSKVQEEGASLEVQEMRGKQIAKERGWNDIPGRIELITGISYFELDKVEEARSNLLLATNFEDTKDTAEGWLSYINQF